MGFCDPETTTTPMRKADEGRYMARAEARARAIPMGYRGPGSRQYSRRCGMNSKVSSAAAAMAISRRRIRT